MSRRSRSSKARRKSVPKSVRPATRPSEERRANGDAPVGRRVGWPVLLTGGVLVAVALVVGFWQMRSSERLGEAPVAEASKADSQTPPGEVRREPGLNVLLITIDTLRADALGSYGNPRAETPWMDRLAAEGVRFEDAYAHNVLTLPSHANILAGLYPQEHGVRDNSGFRFPSAVETLASVLAADGYRTGAFVSAFPLDSRFGLDRGFEVYEDSFVDARSRPAFLEQERSGPETVALAERWIGADDGRPYFAWVHLYEPHFPYAPPEPWASRFAADPYLGDVAAADAALGPLLRPILTGGEADAAGASETLVVLTSDHGESLGEHGEATHGIFAYESVLKVPLILHQPDLFVARQVSVPARHVDLMPTILDALAIATPPGVRGRSLLEASVGRAPAGAPERDESVYFEALSGQLNRGWAPLYGVIDKGWKFIDLPIPELYHLNEDPRELDNRAESEAERLRGLRAVLEPLRAIDPGSAPSPETAEVRERLAALGYLNAPAASGPREFTPADDPKTLIALDGVLREAASLYDAGRLDEALRLCRDLVRRRPGMRIALMQLAQLERDSGNLDRAVKALQAALALGPDDAGTLALLASYLTQSGRETEAVEVTEPHAALAEPGVEVLLTRTLALARLRRPREAFATLERAREIEPDNPKIAVYAGTVHLMGGQRDQARRAYERALALNPQTASAHSALAIMAVEQGDVAGSLDHWRRAGLADEREYGKLLSVAGGLWGSGRRAEARPLFELFATAAPRSSYRAELTRVERLLGSLPESPE